MTKHERNISVEKVLPRLCMLDAARTACPRKPTFIYFLRCDGYLKVGFSSSPRMRLTSLQYANPYKLEFIKVTRGTEAGEKAIKALLAPYHLRYEWYRLEPEVQAAIDQLPATKAHLKLDRWHKGVLQ